MKYKILHYTETDKTVIQQFKEICKDVGIAWKNPWEWLNEHISFFYDNEPYQYAVDPNCELTCKLCGHSGCGTLWEVALTRENENIMRIPLENNNYLEIELPKSILCGNECINISQQLRNVISEIRRVHPSAKIALTRDHKIKLDVLLKTSEDLATFYFPTSLVHYNTSDYRYKTYVSKHSFRWNTAMLHNTEPTMRSSRYSYKRCPNIPLNFSIWCNYCVVATK